MNLNTLGSIAGGFYQGGRTAGKDIRESMMDLKKMQAVEADIRQGEERIGLAREDIDIQKQMMLLRQKEHEVTTEHNKEILRLKQEEEARAKEMQDYTIAGLRWKAFTEVGNVTGAIYDLANNPHFKGLIDPEKAIQNQEEFVKDIDKIHKNFLDMQSGKNKGITMDILRMQLTSVFNKYPAMTAQQKEVVTNTQIQLNKIAEEKNELSKIIVKGKYGNENVPDKQQLYNWLTSAEMGYDHEEAMKLVYPPKDDVLYRALNTAMLKILSNPMDSIQNMPPAQQKVELQRRLKMVQDVVEQFVGEKAPQGGGTTGKIPTFEEYYKAAKALPQNKRFTREQIRKAYEHEFGVGGK